jgi:hypothetical protein
MRRSTGPTASPIRWGRLALICLAALPVGTIGFAVMSMTVGLITGLIVVMIPLWGLFVQGTLTLLFVSLCMKARLSIAARVVGGVCLLAPAVYATLQYAGAISLCHRLDDSEACLAYLNGSPPLLQFAVVAYGIVSLVAFAGFFPLMRMVGARTAE